jgi:hypothetical protein
MGTIIWNGKYMVLICQVGGYVDIDHRLSFLQHLLHIHTMSTTLHTYITTSTNVYVQRHWYEICMTARWFSIYYLVI